MEIRNYLNTLNNGIFLLNIQDLIIPENDIIESFINSYKNKNYSLIFILYDLINKNFNILKQDKELTSVLNYQKQLINLILNKLNKNYSDEIKTLLVYYVLSENDLSSIQNELIEILNYNFNNLEDEIWYIYESLKYKLLELYLQKPFENIDNIRILTEEIKNNQKKYLDIVNKLENI